MDAISRILKDKKVVLFDFDGTLVDSMGMWGEVDKAILRLHGFPIPDNFTEEFMFPLIPLTEEETAQFFLIRSSSSRRSSMSSTSTQSRVLPSLSRLCARRASRSVSLPPRPSGAFSRAWSATV